MDINDLKIAVIGAGSWGTALADLLASKGLRIDFWVYEKEVRDQIADYRENKMYLPGALLSENLYPSNDIEEVASGKDLLLLVVPSHVMRVTTLAMAPYVSGDTIVVSASKGIENETLLTMSGVLAETLPAVPASQITVLSGPSFAREVVDRVPTVVTAAAKDERVAGLVQQVFATPYFRVYTNEDVIGLELGGSLKNVIALAAGIVEGMGLGLNTRAALITRGLAEIRRLGEKMGANPRTFAGIAGVGDLVLTCTGELSRNHTVGKKIGQGKTIEEILSEMHMVAEGVKTAKSVYNLARKLDVDMPISHEIHNIIYNHVSPKEAVHRLMTRDLKHEFV